MFFDQLKAFTYPAIDYINLFIPKFKEHYNRGALKFYSYYYYYY